MPETKPGGPTCPIGAAFMQRAPSRLFNPVGFGATPMGVGLTPLRSPGLAEPLGSPRLGSNPMIERPREGRQQAGAELLDKSIPSFLPRCATAAC